MKRLLVSLVAPAGIVAFTFAGGCGETTDLGGAVLDTAVHAADAGDHGPDDAAADGPAFDEGPDPVDATTSDDAESDGSVPLAEAGDDDDEGGSEPGDAAAPVGEDGAVGDASDFD